ncbi:GAF domain-containing protein [Stappia sp. GBMRC 2046]|uniref:GAF domain-containing protein n=1 Tax=Stappia sediminis TaxID=2692190 RepID=A0A7X3LXY9_9HYPH|nr:adenylate/guanylate cyclase domain-containing protein [Stappia sediminis]MXN67181.1 GAF domain-containing protein [Stappia sediminis]
MKISSKILWATLPLLLAAFAAASGITYFLSREALREIAEQWLETRGQEALQAAQNQAEFLKAYSLDTVEASVRQAQSDAAAIMATIEIGQEGFVLVIDGSGRIAHAPDPGLVGADVGKEPWFAEMTSGQDGQISYRFGGQKYLGSVHYFEPWQWYVVATDPESEVYGAVNRLGTYVLILGLAGSVLIAIVLMTLTRRLTAPLAELVQGAERVGRGELDTTIPVRTQDEVGMLARSFNDMTDELRVLYGRLEERLTTVVSNAPIILFALDGNGAITLLEGKGLDTLGLDPEGAIGRPLSGVFASSPEILSAAETARRGETASSVAALHDQIFEVWCAPHAGSSGDASGVIGVATDVTERVLAQEKLRRQADYLTALNETTLGIISRLDLDELLQAIVTRAGEMLDAAHGYIYLADEADAAIRRRIGVGVYAESVGYELQPGQGVAGKVWMSGDPVVVNDYANWPDRVPNPRHDGFIRAVIGVPLKSGTQVIGVLGMAYDERSERNFGEEEASVLSRFAELASISLDNARLYASAQAALRKAEEANERVLEQNRMLESLSTKLSKYLSPQVYSSIFTGSQSVEISAKRKKLTVFFSDIAGFTETADKMESEDLTQLLNHYLTEMSRIALAHGATIDKYVGDAIVIFFGDPETRGVREDALACVKMAIAMRKRMRELAGLWRASGIENPLRCRIGINTGYCTVGNFGSEDRMDYTIIGGGVNLASRLETSAEPGEILISYETFAHVKNEIHCEERGHITVKGLAYPVMTYRVVDSYEALGTSGRQLREEMPNMRLDLDAGLMSPDQRAQATAILKKALDELSN